jgi:hypothetical protein
MGTLAFWIVTPAAVERAAFQENGGTDARPIMDGKTFGVEDNTCGHSVDYATKKSVQ